jgi:hypothetical protein
LASRGSHRNWHRIAQSNVSAKALAFEDISCHRCKRKKQVLPVTQFHDFGKYFVDPPLCDVNAVFTKSILRGVAARASSSKFSTHGNRSWC